MSGIQSHSTQKLFYQFENLNRDERETINTFEEGLTSESKDEKSLALIEAMNEFDRAIGSIENLIIRIENYEKELETLKSRLVVLEKDIHGKDNILDIQQRIGELIKNLSTPVGLVALAIGGVVTPAVAVPVLTRYFGSTMSDVSASKLESPSKNSEKQQIESTTTAEVEFTFSNTKKVWYKAIQELIAEKSDKNKILSKLLVVLNRNDVKEYNLKIIFDVFSNALVKAQKDEANLQKELEEKKFIRIFFSTVNSLAANIPGASQVTSILVHSSESIGKYLPQALKRKSLEPADTKDSKSDTDVKKEGSPEIKKKKQEKDS